MSELTQGKIRALILGVISTVLCKSHKQSLCYRGRQVTDVPTATLLLTRHCIFTDDCITRDCP